LTRGVPKELQVESNLEWPVFRNRNLTNLASGAMLIALAAFSLFSVSYADEQAPPAAPAQVDESPLPEIAIGKADAPVTIIEYSSLSCPHCAAFHRDVFPALKSEYIDTGKARYVMREFPLNESALAGAVLARCLDPSRYVAFADLLFSKQEEWAYKQDALTPLKDIAKQAGMTSDEFDKCIDNEALQKKILDVRDEGQKKGVNATPNFFINGTQLTGAPTLESFAEAMKPYLSTQ
jgi:protein-disulfide isomerase